MDRLTDTSRYGGTHKQRFDAEGKGRGKAGREDGKGDGYVQVGQEDITEIALAYSFRFSAFDICLHSHFRLLLFFPQGLQAQGILRKDEISSAGLSAHGRNKNHSLTSYLRIVQRATSGMRRNQDSLPSTPTNLQNNILQTLETCSVPYV